MALSYTSVADVQANVTRIGSTPSFTSSQIGFYATLVEARMDSKLQALYSVPVSSENGVLRSIATDMTTYELLAKNMTWTNLGETQWPKLYENAMSLLDDIAAGEVAISGPGGAVISPAYGLATSNTRQYLPTFADGLDFEQMTVDEEKIDDTEDARS